MSFMNNMFFGKNFVSVSFALYGEVCTDNKLIVNALVVAIKEEGIFMPTSLEFREEKLLVENLHGYAGYMVCISRFLPRFHKHSGGW